MQEYQTVHMMGAECYTNAYIISISDSANATIYFISLYGRVGAVKAVGAAILEGATIYINDQPAGRPYGKSLRTITQNLGHGVCHKVLLCPDYFQGNTRSRILLGEDKKRAFVFLDCNVSTPLAQEWVEWVWAHVFQPEPLRGFGELDGRDLSSALMITQNKTSSEIDELVLEALRSGEL